MSIRVENVVDRLGPDHVLADGAGGFGGALAGYIVARVSGMPFDDYIDKNLFAPLDMQHSTFRQPLPGSFVSNMSDGYSAASFPASAFRRHLGSQPTVRCLDRWADSRRT